MQLESQDNVAPTMATSNRGELTPPEAEAGDRLGLRLEVMGARLKGKLFGSKQSFPKCGRFEVLGQLGAGGMGVVFEGWDPDLERKVALKVLHESASKSSKQRKRMVREAQTLAKLSHPNVVQVYEVGVHGDRLFIAMEYIEGETLRSWLRREEPDWKEVLARYVEAGRGLVAAHAEGLVHRDFKPDNVMVTKDGDVRVLDFGLAREELGDDALSQLGQVRPDELTQTGTLMGTPYYMAPEQFEGKATDARTDQFSFCVALWEGVFGEPPFQAGTIDALSKRVRSGKLEEPDRGDVPAWVHKVLLRGLSTNPGERFTDIPSLLAALTPKRRSPWALGGAFVGLAGLAVAAGVMLSQPEPPPVCPDPTAELEGVWDTETRAKMKAAILASGLDEADSHWSRAEANIDAWVNSWVAASQDNCEDTRVRETQAIETMRVRASCLDARFQNLNALIDGVLDDKRMGQWAAPMTKMLPKVDGCAVTRTAEVWPPLPEDPAMREDVQRLRGKVALMRLLQYASFDLNSEVSSEIEEEIAAVNDGPLLARFWLANGSVDMNSDPKKLERAYMEAERTGDDRTAAEAASAAAGMHQAAGDEAEAERWAELARVKAERMGKDDELMVTVRNRLADLEPPEKIIAEREQIVELAERALGTDHPYAWTLMANLGVRYMEVGRNREALAMFRRCAHSATVAMGGDSDATWRCAGGVAQAQSKLRDCPGAVQTVKELFEERHDLHSTRANDAFAFVDALQNCDPKTGRELVADLAAGAPAGSDDRTTLLAFHGSLSMTLGSSPELKDQEAMDSFVGSSSEHKQWMALIHRFQERRLAGDLDEQRAILDTLSELQGEKVSSMRKAPEAYLRPHIELEAGDPAKALAMVEALDNLEPVQGLDPGLIAGRALHDLGRHDEAVTMLEPRVQLPPRAPDDALAVFALAKSLAATGKLERARSLAVQAKSGLEPTGPFFASHREGIDAWLEKHGDRN
jgi:serine/threonine-protein kinase